MGDSRPLASQNKNEGSHCRRVLVLTPVGPQGRGGIDRLNLYIQTYMQHHGLASGLTFMSSRGAWPAPFWTIHFVAALVRFIFECGFKRHDAVHIHVSTRGSALRKFIFSLIARLLRVPVIIQFHGLMSAEYESARPVWFRALAIMARHAQCVIVLGETYRAALERMGVESARIAVIHNGIQDIGVTRPLSVPAHINIMFSGEVGERKGAHLLIAALTQLSKSNQPWRCTIAGNGDLAPYRAAVIAGGIQDRVEFTGWIGIERIHDLMREAEIIVLPSRAEALPLALIEGASASAALIACDVGAVGDVVVDGVNGIIVQRDAAHISAAIHRLLTDGELRRRMQNESRRIYLERFQIERCAHAILAVYDQACKG